jgi:hypothetical protein
MIRRLDQLLKHDLGPAIDFGQSDPIVRIAMDNLTE